MGHRNEDVPEERQAGRGSPLVHFLNAALLAGIWWWSWRVFPTLPDQIPGHIGPGGVRWDDTSFGGWFLLPMLAAGMTALNYTLGPVIRRTRRVNLPSSVPFEELLPGDQEEVLDLTVRFLRWMNATLVAGFFLLQLGSWEIAVGAAEGIGPTTIFGILFLTLVPNFAALAFLALVMRAVGDAERRAREAALAEVGS